MEHPLAEHHPQTGRGAQKSPAPKGGDRAVSFN
jgi:hypothetical protein